MSKANSKSKKDFAKIIGKNLKKYREKRGFTLRELAKRTEYSTGYIGLIEKAKSTPNSYVIKDLSDALNVPIAAIYGEEDAIKSTQELRDPILSKKDNEEYLELIKSIIVKDIPVEKVKKAIDFIENI